MKTRHLVDPELAPMLNVFPSIQLTPELLPQARAMLAEIQALQQAQVPSFPDIDVMEYSVPGPQDAPEVPVIVSIPRWAQRPMPALLWIHGGGYVLGNAKADQALAMNIASQASCAVVSVDYRLAPETPFPGPVEDCYAALKWLSAQTEKLGVDPNRIAIGGASAGGGLAAGLGLLARDRGEVPLVFQLLIYPMLDDRTVSAAEPHPYTGEFIWTAEANRFGWTSFLGQEPGSPGVSPYAAAARAESVAGLPPTYLCVGSLDLFLEENMEYARRLIREGVPTELHVYPAAYHGFNMAVEAQVTQAFERDYMNALRRALSTT